MQIGIEKRSQVVLWKWHSFSSPLRGIRGISPRLRAVRAPSLRRLSLYDFSSVFESRAVQTEVFDLRHCATVDGLKKLPLLTILGRIEDLK